MAWVIIMMITVLILVNGEMTSEMESASNNLKKRKKSISEPLWKIGMKEREN